jgi:hypothetical protein
MNRKNRTMALAAFAVASMFLVSGFSGLADVGYSASVDLIAGQHYDAGEVTVSDDGTNLIIEFTTVEGWKITETHVDVVTDPADFPTTQKGNPQVGKFAYSMEHDYVTEFTYEIPLVGDGYDWDGETLYVAAHAVVVMGIAPYYASSIVDYDQGLKKSGAPVDAIRSDPENGLYFEDGQDPSNFFSLGFNGWIILEWDCPIVNGDGNDVKVWEDTWGSYPLETAEVYASQDGNTWYDLGQADNTDNVDIHTVSYFDLGDLEWAKYIKVVDTTNPAVHGSTADGYDLNAVEALQDCACPQWETAWGAANDGIDFGGHSWATYFTVEA